MKIKKIFSYKYIGEWKFRFHEKYIKNEKFDIYK